MGLSYDANGNVYATSYTIYDAENQMTNYGAGPTRTYGYDAFNRRVLVQEYSGPEDDLSAEEVTFYGPGGERLGVYRREISHDPYQVGGFGGGQAQVWFGGKLIQAGGQKVVQDRLGSVAVQGSERVRFWPYGEERGTTAQKRQKWATYWRDDTGLDYAMARYQQNGRFRSPDPAAPGDPADPQSWNLYAYVQGDPINFNDPDGLVRCGDLAILGTTTTLGEAMRARTDLGLLANLVWAESAHTWSRQGTPSYYAEQDAIAWSVLNRWKILNGYLSVSGFANPALLGWGPYGASIAQILGQPGQYSTIAGGPSNPHLRGDLQSDLDDVLDEEPTAGDHIDIQVGNTITSMTHNCYNVWQSWVTASFALSGSSKDPFAGRGYTTSFHHGLTTTQLEPYLGSFGTANNFFGISGSQVTVNPIPREPPPRRNPGPPRRSR